MDRAGADVASLTCGMKIYPRGESTERRVFSRS
jgi:hypothetical protein